MPSCKVCGAPVEKEDSTKCVYCGSALSPTEVRYYVSDEAKKNMVEQKLRDTLGYILKNGEYKLSQEGNWFDYHLVKVSKVTSHGLFLTRTRTFKDWVIVVEGFWTDKAWNDFTVTSRDKTFNEICKKLANALSEFSTVNCILT